MPEAGPTTWVTPFVANGLFIDGDFFDAQRSVPGFASTEPGPGTILATLGQTDVEQIFWVQGDAPVNAQAPLSQTLAIQLTREEDFHKLESWRLRGVAVDLWFDWPMSDYWYIPGALTDQTDWKASRKFPWDGGVPGITQTSHPPKAFIDDVEQTIITAGVPAGGEVLVPDASGFNLIETPVLVAGTWLQLRYHPVLQARINSLQSEYAQHNALVVSLEIVEVRAALFQQGF